MFRRIINSFITICFIRILMTGCTTDNDNPFKLPSITNLPITNTPLTTPQLSIIPFRGHPTTSQTSQITNTPPTFVSTQVGLGISGIDAKDQLVDHIFDPVHNGSFLLDTRINKHNI